MTTVSAVICAYGSQPYLRAVVQALQASEGVDIEVIVVDNGSPDCEDLPGARIIRPGHNTGYAGGCNIGARAAGSPIVAFVNSDAIVDSMCLSRLATGLQDRALRLVGATIVLADEPEVINSWGNPVHVLGFSWAGGYGEPVTQARTGPRASVSGAVFAVRRKDFLALGGFDEAYFMYGEDLDLSLRSWLDAGRVEVLSEARATHHYEFGRNGRKLGLLERNRLITVLTVYEGLTLFALSPLLLVAEAATVLRGAREGWLTQKVDGWRWLIAHRQYLRRRRNRIQGTRRIPDAQLLPHLTPVLQPPPRFGISVSATQQALIAGYCRTVVRAVVRAHHMRG